MDPKHIVNLSGKDYPLYGGVLAEAHERGLQAIETTLVQIPDESNGHLAIVKAKVTMKDGSVFEGYGDASPRNTNARIATALVRMAETRGKGRALRDACNIGETLLEELPDPDDAAAYSPTAGATRVKARDHGPSAPERAYYQDVDESARKRADAPAACEVCGAVVTKGQLAVSMHSFKRVLCPVHQAEAKSKEQAA